MSESTLFVLGDGVYGGYQQMFDGRFALLAKDMNTGRELRGIEANLEGAHGWLEGAALVFAEPEGSA